MRGFIFATAAVVSLCAAVHADTIPQSTLMVTPSTTNYSYAGTPVSFVSNPAIYGLDTSPDFWDGLHIGSSSSTSVTFNFSQPVSMFAFDFTAHSNVNGHLEQFSNFVPSAWTLTNNSLPNHETVAVGNTIVPQVDDGWGTVTFNNGPYNSISFDLEYLSGAPAGTVLTEIRYTPNIPEPTALALVGGAMALVLRRR